MCSSDLLELGGQPALRDRCHLPDGSRDLHLSRVGTWQPSRFLWPELCRSQSFPQQFLRPRSIVRFLFQAGPVSSVSVATERGLPKLEQFLRKGLTSPKPSTPQMTAPRVDLRAQRDLSTAHRAVDRKSVV